MLQTLATPAQLLRANQAIPDSDARQQMVLLRFATPIGRAWVWEFLRIHLTPGMLAGGEGDFFNVHLHQPQHCGARTCSACSHQLAPVGQYRGRCVNASCKRFRKEESHAPKRGVVRVLIPSDCLQVVDGREVCSSVLLVLDRRYREEVLAAVYRTAGMICDQYGWKLK